MGWYQTLKPALQDRVRRYLNTDGNIIHYDMIRAAMGSIARYAIYPVQDLLGFGSDCRMNTPSDCRRQLGIPLPQGSSDS